jgi:hypothetical protein
VPEGEKGRGKGKKKRKINIHLASVSKTERETSSINKRGVAFLPAEHATFLVQPHSLDQKGRLAFRSKGRDPLQDASHCNSGYAQWAFFSCLFAFLNKPVGRMYAAAACTGMYVRLAGSLPWWPNGVSECEFSDQVTDTCIDFAACSATLLTASLV